MQRFLAALVTFVLLLGTVTVHAEIFRGFNGPVIPGTEGIAPGPGVDLNGWNSESHNLQGANFFGGDPGSSHGFLDLTGANFGDSWLDDAIFQTAILANASLAGANLSNANFGSAALMNADLTGAVVTEANFGDTTSRGFTQAQLYSTQSYQDKNLAGLGLFGNDLSEWDFSGQDLTHAYFSVEPLAGFQASNLVGANLSEANLANSELSFVGLANANLNGANLANARLYATDLRGAHSANLAGALNTQNMIRPDGTIAGLDLYFLIVRDHDGDTRIDPALPPVPITIQDYMTSYNGALSLVFDADPWNSLISFEPGIPIQLGGTLELTFARDADPASQVGRTLHLFDWNAVSPTGIFTVSSSSLYDWDLTSLYTTGEVTLLAAGRVIAGDANGDGRVDANDFTTLKVHFGAAGSRAEGDANGDGRIDLADFGLLKVNFGKSAVAVSEPASSVLAMLALVGCVAARCRGILKARRWRRRLAGIEGVCEAH